MSVTFDGNKTITIDGEGTFNSPFFFCSGIYAADQAGGWGKMLKAGNDYQYNLDAKVIITGNSYVVDDCKQILINHLTVGESEFIVRVEDGFMRLGYTNDASTYDCRGGCSIIYINNNVTGGKTDILWNDPDDGELHLYGCHIRNRGNNLGRIFCSNGRVWNCRMEGTYLINLGYGDSVSVHNNTIQVAYRAQSQFYADSYGLRDKYFHVTYWIVTPHRFMDGDHIKGIYAREYESLVNIQDEYSGTDEKTIYVGQDFDVDNWEVNFRYWVTGNPKVVREHLFDLKVIGDGSALSGATATLYNSDDEEVFSVDTDSGGDIAQQLVVRSYCQKTWDDGTYDEDIKMDLDTDATKDYGPFYLKVEKEGYGTRWIHNIELGKDTELQIELLSSEGYTETAIWESVEKKIVSYMGSNWGGIPVQYPNQSYDPTGQEAWMSMVIYSLSSDRITITGNDDTGILYKGQLMFNVHRLRNKGTGTLKTYVDDLADLFRYMRISMTGEKYIEFFVPQVDTLGRNGDWWVDSVVIPFEYLE